MKENCKQIGLQQKQTYIFHTHSTFFVLYTISIWIVSGWIQFVSIQRISLGVVCVCVFFVFLLFWIFFWLLYRHHFISSFFFLVDFNGKWYHFGGYFSDVGKNLLTAFCFVHSYRTVVVEWLCVCFVYGIVLFLFNFYHISLVFCLHFNDLCMHFGHDNSRLIAHYLPFNDHFHVLQLLDSGYWCVFFSICQSQSLSSPITSQIPKRMNTYFEGKECTMSSCIFFLHEDSLTK